MKLRSRTALLARFLRYVLLVVTLAGQSISAQKLVDYTVISDDWVPRTIFEPTLRGNPPWSDGGPRVGIEFHATDVPANSIVRMKYFRPDGSVAYDTGMIPFSGSSTQPNPFYPFSVFGWFLPIWPN